MKLASLNVWVKIFWVEFPGNLWNSTQNILSQSLKDVQFMHKWKSKAPRFMSLKAILKAPLNLYTTAAAAVLAVPGHQQPQCWLQNSTCFHKVSFLNCQKLSVTFVSQLLSFKVAKEILINLIAHQPTTGLTYTACAVCKNTNAFWS